MARATGAASFTAATTAAEKIGIVGQLKQSRSTPFADI
jgi:hypothetical protein